nr:alcohol dehydrogenase catalytic domain-containing protein [Micromonospora sp. DSM 115978]
MRAALIAETPGLVEIADISVDKPTSREVLVRTVGSGLCHSDLHLIDRRHSLVHAFHGMSESGGYALPGHEAAGVVEAVGSDVTYVRPGDHVVTFPRSFCGLCDYCVGGRPSICANSPGARKAGEPFRLSFNNKRVYQMANLGAFAEQLLVHENAIVKIDPEYP